MQAMGTGGVGFICIVLGTPAEWAGTKREGELCSKASQHSKGICSRRIRSRKFLKQTQLVMEWLKQSSRPRGSVHVPVCCQGTGERGAVLDSMYEPAHIGGRLVTRGGGAYCGLAGSSEGTRWQGACLHGHDQHPHLRVLPRCPHPRRVAADGWDLPRLLLRPRRQLPRRSARGGLGQAEGRPQGLLQAQLHGAARAGGVAAAAGVAGRDGEG